MHKKTHATRAESKGSLQLPPPKKAKSQSRHIEAVIMWWNINWACSLKSTCMHLQKSCCFLGTTAHRSMHRHLQQEEDVPFSSERRDVSERKPKDKERQSENSLMFAIVALFLLCGLQLSFLGMGHAGCALNMAPVTLWVSITNPSSKLPSRGYALNLSTGVHHLHQNIMLQLFWQLPQLQQ